MFSKFKHYIIFTFISLVLLNFFDKNMDNIVFPFVNSDTYSSLNFHIKLMIFLFFVFLINIILSVIWDNIRKIKKSTLHIIFITFPISFLLGGTLGDSMDDQVSLLIIFFIVLSLLGKGLHYFYDEIIEKKSDLNTIDSIKKKYENRVLSIRIMNFIIVLLIVCSTIVGMLIFVYAEDLAKTNTQYNRLLSDITERLLYSDRLNSDISGLFEKKTNEKLVNNQILNELKSTQESIQDYKQKLIDFKQKLTTVEDTKKSIYVFISTITNKVGSILILYFFIQILISFYRYNSKLLISYESKLSIIFLDKNLQDKKYKELEKIFTFNNIEFEKKDKAPVSEMMELLKEASSIIKDKKVNSN